MKVQLTSIEDVNMLRLFGREFKTTLGGREALLSLQPFAENPTGKEYFFLLNNTYNGTQPVDLKGFNYGWILYGDYDVTEFRDTPLEVELTMPTFEETLQSYDVRLSKTRIQIGCKTIDKELSAIRAIACGQYEIHRDLRLNIDTPISITISHFKECVSIPFPIFCNIVAAQWLMSKIVKEGEEKTA